MKRNALQPTEAVGSTLGGFKFDQDAFGFAEADTLSFEPLLDVLEGRKSGVVFRSALSDDICSKVTENFETHPKRFMRGAEAPGHYVGAFHYDKTTENYLEAASEIEPTLDLLFEGIPHVWNDFTDWMRGNLAAEGMTFRAAQHGGRTASRFLMRSWVRGGDYALLPHEDEAQCYDPKQKGFEIQDAAKNAVVSVNMCVESGGGGELYYWNIIPDSKSRNQLGLTYTGSPYPIEVLDGIECQVIPIRRGDIYCFNAKTVHAVASINERSDGERLTLAFLTAKLDDNTFIQWT